MRKLTLILFLNLIILCLHAGKLENTLGDFGFVQTKLNEEQKINALLAYIEKTGATFIRNGNEYTCTRAVEHLRMKWYKARSKVKTARDFIDHIASKSSMSDDPYKMKMKNGSVFNVRDVLYVELKRLEK